MHAWTHEAMQWTFLLAIQGGPQLKILACCMAKYLDIVRECMCAKREDPCVWGPGPAQGPWKLWDCRCSLMLYKPYILNIWPQMSCVFKVVQPVLVSYLVTYFSVSPHSPHHDYPSLPVCCGCCGVCSRLCHDAPSVLLQNDKARDADPSGTQLTDIQKGTSYHIISYRGAVVAEQLINLGLPYRRSPVRTPARQ